MVTQIGLKPLGDGWLHRIDQTPDVGRKVEILTDGGEQLGATVVNAENTDPFMGVGCFVGYHTGEGYLSAEKIRYWRYVGHA